MLLLVLLCIAITTGNLNAQELNETQKLKAENFLLKVELAKARATVADRDNKLASIELTNEQQKLVEEFRKALKADEKDLFDWTTLTFSKPK